MPENDFLSIKEFAAYLGVHPDTIRRSIRRGRINAIRVGGGKRTIYRIPKSESNRLAISDMEKILDRLIEKRMTEKS
jgi:excisionase family DNA binding protein